MVKINISSMQKKWIAVISMVLVAAANIRTPIDLSGMIPTQLTTPIIFGISGIGLASYALLVSAYWVVMSETK